MATKAKPKDSMKSTWRVGDRSKWTVYMWLIELFNAHHVALDTPIPVHAKHDKVPYLPQLPQHLWVVFYAFIPVALHQVWLSYTGHQGLNKMAVFVLYLTAFNAVVVREVHILRRLGHRYGFLDGDVHERDGVPDIGVGTVVASIFKTTGSRIAMTIFFAYNPNTAPAATLADWTWWLWLTLDIGLYSIILDFWFYWYHRAMHDVSYLWQYHRTHHLTKHPNPLLTAYADHEQEFFDMVCIPLMTYLTFRAIGVPLGFYEWWICHQYVAYTEVWGHSGVRVHMTPPTTMSWLLQTFRAELAIEDHDLHHRKGWRKSHNYGKQTRIWDRIFGTCIDRIETIPANIDYDNQATMPIF